MSERDPVALDSREAEEARKLSDEGMALPADEIPVGARNGPDLAPGFEPSDDEALLREE